MVSLLTTTVQEFRKVLRTDEKPQGGINTLIKDLKNGLKVQIRTAQKDFLEICLKKDLYPKDVISIAKNISKGNDRRFKVESRRILRDRIMAKNREVREMRQMWRKSSTECRESLKLSHRAEQHL